MAKSDLKNVHLTVETLEFSSGAGPAKVNVICAGHQDVTQIEVWNPEPSIWAVGAVVQATLYQKSYEGQLSWQVSQYGTVSLVTPGAGSGGVPGPVSAPAPNSGHQAPRQAVSATGGASSGGVDRREFGIAYLALGKEQISVGGTKADLEDWLRHYVETMNAFESGTL
jgi:hypothetical protein